MIEVTTGDIFQTGAEALVNPTNCVGPMGAGLAKQFAQRFPDNAASYGKLCRRGEVNPGVLVWYETGLYCPRWIVNLPTKDHYRNPSRLEYVRAGVETLRQGLTQRRVKSVAIPALGAGLGGLDWDDVKPLIVEGLKDMESCLATILEPGPRA